MSDPVVLTHDMVRDKDPAVGWRCVNCGRTGSIRIINQVTCPNQPKGNANVLKAIEGKLR